MRKPIVVAGLLGTLGAAAVGAQQKGVDVTSYHFTITIPDTGGSIVGKAAVRFRTAAGYDDTLRLDLVGMHVDSVTEQDTRKAIAFTYDGKVIRIPAAGLGWHGVVVDYSGTPSDGLIIGTNARGRRAAFGDDWPNRARYWLPTVDHPSDKARVSWTVNAPKGWRTVSNAPQCVKAVAVAACTESVQIPTYTMVIGSTEMAVATHRPAIVGHDTIPIEVWTYAEDSAFANDGPFARATEIVETMSRLVGPFPYSKLAHVESSTRYGGMENATAIFYAEEPYVKRTMREGVVRHETAHQWFGDAVTERDWAHLWLSEGFASYFDLVIGAALSGDSVMVYGLKADKAAWLESAVLNRPVVDIFEKDPNKLLNANVYPKGAWILHMLREQVGDSAFFRGVREYYRAYRDTSVVTAQFQEKIEASSGQKLGWFFQQWLYQPGYPKLEVRWTPDSAAHTVRVTVRQTQPQAWGRYRLPSLPLAFKALDGTIERRSIAVNAQNETMVTVPVAGAMPASITVDPDGTLLVGSTVIPDDLSNGGGGMNQTLRDRILRKLDELPDDRGYQLLDYVEFLESKYAGKTAVAPGVFERFAEGVEDTLRAGKVSASTIAETMGLLNKAMSVLGGVAATGKSIASDAVDTAVRMTAERRVPPAPPPAAAPPAAPAEPAKK